MTSKPIFIIVPAIAYEGISKQVLLQTETLIRLGCTVKIIVLATVDGTVISMLAPSLPKENLFQLNQPDNYLSVRSLLMSFTAALRLARFIKTQNCAVLFAHAPYAHFLVRLAMLLGLNSKGDYKLWQYFHITQYIEFPLTTWRRRLINYLNKKLASVYDFGHIFVSEAVKNDIQSHLLALNNSKVIYNALPAQPKNYIKVGGGVRENDTFTILVPGRVESSKGQLWGLQPYKRLIELRQLMPSQIQLIVAGGGSKLTELKSKVEDEGLNAFVQIIGEVPNDELIGYMKWCDLVLVPSFVEGLPVVILEALQENAVVLASDIQSNVEVINSELVGVLFKTGDVSDCVAKLQYIYQHRNKKIIDSSAIEMLLKNKFSFEKHMQDLMSVIEHS